MRHSRHFNGLQGRTAVCDQYFAVSPALRGQKRPPVSGRKNPFPKAVDGAVDALFEKLEPDRFILKRIRRF
jgi:hypothetical protein